MRRNIALWGGRHCVRKLVLDVFLYVLFSWSKTKDPFKTCFAHHLVYLFAKISIHFSAFKLINYPTDVKGIVCLLQQWQEQLRMSKDGVKRDGKNTPRLWFLKKVKWPIGSPLLKGLALPPSTFLVIPAPVLSFALALALTGHFCGLIWPIKWEVADFFSWTDFLLSVIWIGSGRDPISSQTNA